MCLTFVHALAVQNWEAQQQQLGGKARKEKLEALRAATASFVHSFRQNCTPCFLEKVMNMTAALRACTQPGHAFRSWVRAPTAHAYAQADDSRTHFLSTITTIPRAKLYIRLSLSYPLGNPRRRTSSALLPPTWRRRGVLSRYTLACGEGDCGGNGAG